jgi:Zn-dependent peptidase ImmA (M78 family)
MRDYFIAEGYDEVEWVGKYGATVKAPPIKDVADELREILGMGKHWVTDNEVTSHDDAWRYLRKIIESKRVSVVISGYAGTNTRRKYDVSEFRGFVLSDKYVPMVFINGLDAKTAQLFTLIHELVHLLLAQTGVSYPTYDEANVNTDIEIERFADSVTAEFLVPENVLKEIWSSSGNNEEINIKVAKRQFMVSEIVILRRALDTKLITRETFWRLYNNYAASKTDYENGAHKSSGGNYYATKGTKLGKVFTEAIFTALKSGYLQYGEAYKLTGMRSKVFDRYYQECGYVL